MQTYATPSAPRNASANAGPMPAQAQQAPTPKAAPVAQAPGKAAAGTSCCPPVKGFSGTGTKGGKV